MADTGAPHFIPFAEPTDLVRDWPALSEDVADAVAAGLSAAGGLVAVKHVLKTDTFVSGSVAGGDNVAVPDLEITHEVADANNRLIITALLGQRSSNVGATGIAVHDGTNFIAIGDAAGSRVRVSSGFSVNTQAIANFVHTPGTGSKTYTVRLFNINQTSGTLFVNRLPDDADNAANARYVSSLIIQEVKV